MSALYPLRTHSRVILITSMALAVCNCAHNESVPKELNGQSLIIMGYRADKGVPYEGGMLYTGHRIDTLDGKLIGPPSMAKGDFMLVDPGEHTLEGYCYWQLRGVFHGVDDLQERGQLTIKALPNHVYTIQSDIDEYKVKCDLWAFESTPDGIPDNEEITEDDSLDESANR